MLTGVVSSNLSVRPPAELTPQEVATSKKVEWKNIYILNGLISRISTSVSSLRQPHRGDVQLKDVKPTLSTKKLSIHLAKNSHADVTVKSYFEAPPQPLRRSQIKKEATRIMDGIENQYIRDGCYARAREIIKNAEPVFGEDNVFRVAFQCKGNIEATGKQFQGVKWRYHIAAGVHDHKGNIYIFDPTISQSKPLKIEKWIGKFSINNGLTVKLLPKDVDEFAFNKTSHQLELSANLSRLNSNQSIMNFINSNLTPDKALGDHSKAKNHTAIANYAYTLNPGHPHATRKVSFEQSLAAIMEYHDDQLNAVDMTIITDSSTQGSAIFARPDNTIHATSGNEPILKAMTPAEVEAFMKEKRMERIEVLRIPCVLTDTSCYRVIK